MNRRATIRNSRSVLAIAALAAVLLLILPAPARAQSVSGGQMVYIGSGLCVFGNASATTAWPNGAPGLPFFFNSSSTVNAYSSCPRAVVAKQYAPCMEPFDTGCPGLPFNPNPPVWVAETAPVGAMAVMQQLYVVANGTATYCSTPSAGWQYNSVAEASMTVSSISTAMCGQGYYELGTGVYVKNASGAWEGGWFFIGNLYMDMM